MALSFFLIKKWYLMLKGESILHVNQDIGKHFSTREVSGYYNNMIEKVTKMPELLGSDELPKLNLEGGKSIYFPVAIFQYGLGAYDLFLQTRDKKYLSKFMQCAQWTLDQQDPQGRWKNFFHINERAPFGAMAQGEAASLLIRAFVHTGDSHFLDAAKKSIDYMLLPIEKGGTTKYEQANAYLMEFTFLDMVLNGSIFAWWGLYDFVLITGDNGIYKRALESTLNSIINVLPQFKNSFWSIYSLDGRIASPFYHNLHIAQMQAMYILTGKDIFNEYAILWTKQQNKLSNKSFAFLIKAIQKIFEK